MRNRKKYNMFILIFIILIFFGISNKVFSEKEKLVFVTVEDKNLLECAENNYSTGLLSLKPYNKNKINSYLGISYRRSFLKDIEFPIEIKYRDDGINILNFQKLKKQLEDEYPNIDKKRGNKSIGQLLKENGFKISYFGESLDSIILADEKGNYDFGKKRILDKDMKNIDKFLENEFKKSDIIFISLKKEQEKYLDDILNLNYPLLVFSEYKEQKRIIKNKSISTAIYKNKSEEKGILTSKSTNRKGLINNFDIGNTILNFYNINIDNDGGNKIEVIKGNNKDLEKNLNSYMNLTLSKYIFHGLTIIISFITIIMYFFKMKSYIKNKKLIYLPIVFILVSLIIGKISYIKNLYTIAIIIISFIIFAFLCKYKINIKNIIILIDIIIITSLFTCKEILYNSFIGYNSILAGGRYYGLNNDIMGIFIASGLFLALTEYEKGRKKISLSILLIHTLALTGKYGSNFGGLLTSISALVLFAYYFLLNKYNKKKIIYVVPCIFGIVLAIIFIGKGESNHIVNFFERVYNYGFLEFEDMIHKKTVHLFKMSLIPPWSIVFILESLYFIKRIKSDKNMKKIIKVFFITSIFALLFNDTGIVAFTYINLITLAIIAEKEKNKDIKIRGN